MYNTFSIRWFLKGEITIMRLGMMTETFKRFISQEESLRYIKEFGFDVADITLFKTGERHALDPDIFGSDYIKRAREIRKYADELNLPIVQAHAPFPIYKNDDEEYNKNIFEVLEKCIVVCGILGVKNIIIHPCNNWDYKKNAAFFRKLLPAAKKNNVVICTENMWNWNREENHAILAACSSPEDFLKHVEEVDDDYLQACVDVGHANMFSMVDKSITPGNMVRVLNKHVKCFHIHDNDGIRDRHATPFTMTLDWDDLAKAIKEINYNSDLIIEICDDPSLSFDETIKRNKEQFNAAKRLLELIEK